ncbi:hypothetical protein [Streptomyces sp. NBC_01304]|uniref:hypothetical protein n=1 Tax=Streptomyces sp. NBC_01304 TaxID=2903818 RepID=UPI002E114811|nr:hypothetical protein OG430_37425 [Streptomyces sp. NBC_01304]
MPARTHTRSPEQSRGSVEVKLPWWAVALPTIAFVVLLMLILNPAEAQAASGHPGVADFFDRVQESLLFQAP